MRESAFVSPWAVEHLPNPFIFPALFAAYNVARAAFGAQDNEPLSSHEAGGEDVGSLGVLVEKCNKCGSSFRTPGLLR